jgi:hypothetical protein
MDPFEARLWRDALALPEKARAALACRLLESLEADDPDAETKWAEEPTNRIRDMERGSVRLVPLSEARRAILGH